MRVAVAQVVIVSAVAASACSRPAQSSNSAVSPTPATAPAPADSPSGAELVIYDPRQDEAPGITMLVGPKRLDAAATRRILDSVFGRDYLSDYRDCKGGAGSAAEARAAGDFAPSVFESARGFFTNAGKQQQTLYVIPLGECGASHAENFGTVMLAVLQGDALVAKALVDGGSSLGGVFDLDGDGRNELLLTTGYTGQGYTTVSAKLVQFEGGNLIDIKTFGQVMLDGCGTGDPKATSEFSVIHARTQPRAAAQFRVESKKEACH
jgi:hypothetical protein